MIFQKVQYIFLSSWYIFEMPHLLLFSVPVNPSPSAPYDVSVSEALQQITPTQEKLRTKNIVRDEFRNELS